MKKNILKQTLVLFSLAVVVLSVAYYFVFMGIKNKNEHVSVLENNMASGSKNQQYLASLQKTVTEAEYNIHLVNSAVIASDGDVKFIEDLEGLAHNNGLSISIESLDLVDDPNIASTDITVLHIKIKTSGGWSGTYRFISEVESLPQKTKIQTLTMHSTVSDFGNNKKSTSAVWSSELEIIVLKNK